MDDIRRIAERYGGVAPRVVARANEYMRITAARKSAAVDLSTPAACLLVAARSFDDPLDVKRLSKYASVQQRAVDMSARKVLSAVNVRSVVQTTPAALCIRFGCEAITERVHRVVDEYQGVAERLARRRNGKDPVIDLHNPVFAAACLFATSKQANLRVDKTKLIDAVCGRSKEFDAIVSSIETHCKVSLSGALLSRRKRTALTSPSPSPSTVKRSALQSSQPTRSAPPAALRRLYERPGDETSHPATSNKTTKPSPAAIITGPSAAEYAEWRAMAIAHMQQQQQTAATTATE